jgi:hypothetical protein
LTSPAAAPPSPSRRAFRSGAGRRCGCACRGEAAADADPIFAAIDEHRAAQAIVDVQSYKDYHGNVADGVNPIFADWSHACDAVAEQVLDEEPATIAGVSAALSYFTPFAIEDAMLPDVWLDDAHEPRPFSEGLLVWAARSFAGADRGRRQCLSPPRILSGCRFLSSRSWRQSIRATQSKRETSLRSRSATAALPC